MVSAIRSAAVVAALLLRAAADACDAFARALITPTVPDTVPEWLNEEVDLP